MCGAKCHTEQSVMPHTWWGSSVGSMGATSKVPHRVLNAPVIDTAIDKTQYSCYMVHIWCVELSTTRNKVPHYTCGGGYLLGPLGAPLGSHITSLVY